MWKLIIAIGSLLGVLTMSAPLQAPIIDAKTVRVTTNTSGFAYVQHSLGIKPASVTVTPVAPISGAKIPSQVLVDSFTATSFRIRVFTVTGAIFASASVTLSYTAIAENPTAIASGYYTEPTDPTGFDAYEALIGKRPEMVMWYWQLPWGFPTERANDIASRGQTPILSLGTEGISNADIVAGKVDDTIYKFIYSVKAFGQPLWLRYGWEMNGTWYNWSDLDFVAAWKHVQDKFREQNVTNVKWVWSPNVVGNGYLPLGDMFPGNDRVDVVALDGYNWGTSQSWSKWQTFSQVFGESINQVRALAPSKPLWVGETASSELGGDKAAWIRDMYLQLRSYNIAGFVWFNLDKETDWRVNSSQASLDAFKAG